MPIPPRMLLLASAVLWSLGGLLIKSADAQPLAIAGGRSLFAAITIGVVLRGRAVRFSPRVAAGSLAYSATVILFVVSTRWTTAANAVLLQYTAPAYVALGGQFFLGESVSRRDFAILASTIAGVALLCLDDIGSGQTPGNLAAAAGGICYASLILCMRMEKRGEPGAVAFWGNLLTLAVCLPSLFASVPGRAVWFRFAIMGVCQLGLPYLLYAAAIRKVRALDASLIGALEPCLNPLWVFFALGEKPSLWSISGGVIILGCLAGQVIGRPSPKEEVQTFQGT